MAKKEGVKDVFVHCILDGRDVPARSADIFLEALEIKTAEIGIGKIATLCGRHFAMDAGENWDRTARAFTMMVHSEGERASDPVTAVRSSFLRGIADEFTAPIVLESAPDIPVAAIKDGDGVIFFNHRSDTMRQLVRALAMPDPGTGAASAKPQIDCVCLIEYDRSFDLKVAFPHDDSGSSLNSVLMENEVENWRIAETERYPHVTGFMNAGTIPAGHFQRNILINSTRPSHRLPEPEMASFKLADQLIRSIEEGAGGFHLANFSAADLAAESGDLDRTVEAVQFIDTCLGGVLDAIEERNGVLIVASTHGNCEAVGKYMSANQLQTGTTNHVPFMLIDASGEKTRLREKGSIQDIAPTILGLLGIDPPKDMTGVDLRLN
jgi:2,3-bisphosphoglycerate-independent phosphoglycerate mutase